MRKYTFSFVIAISFAACNVSPSSHPVGIASAKITSVPANVACIAIEARGVVDNLVSARNFDVTSGQPAQLTWTGMAAGHYLFSAYAWPQKCSDLTAPNTWATPSPVAADVNADSTTNLELTLVPAGSVGIGISFADGGTAGDGGTIDDGGIPFDGGAPLDGGNGCTCSVDGDGGTVCTCWPAYDMAYGPHQ